MTVIVPQVTIWTDGSCHPNPGPGGWSALLLYHKPGREKPVGKWFIGSNIESTNNRMELIGAIEGMKAIKIPADVTICSDSQYITEGIGAWKNGEAVPPYGWMPKWIKGNWTKLRDGSPVMNKELWQLVHEQVRRHASIRTKWVRGHDGNVLNEECDRRANEARLELMALQNGLTTEATYVDTTAVQDQPSIRPTTAG